MKDDAVLSVGSAKFETDTALGMSENAVRPINNFMRECNQWDCNICCHSWVVVLVWSM